MTEATVNETEPMEIEIRGGAWEGIHALIFYTAVTLAVLASLGILRIAFGITFIILLFYSIFAIFSSPTYIIIDARAREVTLERYRYFIPSRRSYGQGELGGLEVVESPRVPAAEGEKGSRRDLSYYVRVYLVLNDGKRLRIFRSGMTGAPAENRRKASLIVENIVDALGIPVTYNQPGKGKPGEDA
jgi:hypothetical protein